MFTGLIEECGVLATYDTNEGGARITVKGPLVAGGSSVGDSISVNGVCLTAVDVTPTSFAADLSRETLDRTTLGELQQGARVNLERAVLPTTRMGGHIVQGHVDGRGTFVTAFPEGDFRTVTIEFPPELARYFVEKGSVTIDGISLTIAALRGSSFDIAVIPKTWDVTNLSTLKQGDHVNLEVDVIAKYVERMMLDAYSQQMKGNVDRS